MENVKTNGHDKVADEGLMALRRSFKGAKYLNSLGKKAAQMMMRGAHRNQQIPDAVIMEVYAGVTAGKNVQLKLESDEGKGYVANIESYADMIAFMEGSLVATVIKRVEP